jgi:hypothetical protein
VGFLGKFQLEVNEQHCGKLRVSSLHFTFFLVLLDFFDLLFMKDDWGNYKKTINFAPFKNVGRYFPLNGFFCPFYGQNVTNEEFTHEMG